MPEQFENGRTLHGFPQAGVPQLFAAKIASDANLPPLMYNVFVPHDCRGKFYPSVFLGAIRAFGLDPILNIVPDVPLSLQGWSLLIRLPSVYHLRKQGRNNQSIIAGVFDIIEPYRAAVKKCSARIVLDMGVECFFARDELFQELHSLIEEYGLASCSIVISNGNQLVGERYHDFCVQRNQLELVEFVAT